MNYPFYEFQSLKEGEIDKFITNKNDVAIRTLCKPTSTDFTLNIGTEIMVSFHNVWLWNQLTGLDVFSVIRFWPWNQLKGFDSFSVTRLKRYVDFFIGKLLGIFYFPSAFVVLAKSFEKKFLRSFISKDVFPVIVN